jgi:acyl-coenzyme A thioesterase PaaI-like protein
MTALIFRSTAVFRTLMNVYPPYWGTGISVAEVAPDWRRMVVRMRQRFYNANAFGTHFGGSLYAMCDPHYVLLLIPLLGRDYVVWDKAAAIEFVKPGRGTVQAVFEWNAAQLEEIRARTADGGKFEPQRCVEVVDAAGEVIARVHKTLYVRRKQAA